MIFRENDKVIQLSNMPDENVFNGDIGIITEIYNGSKKKKYTLTLMGILFAIHQLIFKNSNMLMLLVFIKVKVVSLILF